MSEKELCVQLLEKVPPYKMRYLLAYIQGLTADEDADDSICEQIYQEYMADQGRRDYVSFDQALRECGVAADEL